MEVNISFKVLYPAIVGLSMKSIQHVLGTGVFFGVDEEREPAKSCISQSTKILFEK